MRMWLINPKKMCRKHLLGEHFEMHMFSSLIKKRKKYSGYIKNNLIETGKIKKRHDELAKEMLRKGYHHKSPLKKIKVKNQGKINIKKNIKKLKKRCKECRKLLR